MLNNYTGSYRIKILLLLVTLVVIIFTIVFSGCRQPSLKNYENQRWHFSLEYPDNWTLSENSRVSNDFSLKATKGLFNKSRVRIEILSVFPATEETTPVELEIAMENYLTSVAEMTHIYKSMEILQVSNVIDNDYHKMIWATISVPTIDITEDANAKSNQMGQRDENTFQLIDIYILQSRHGRKIEIEVYKGTNEDLNSQADEIVQSIRFINE